MLREYTVFNVDQCDGLPDRIRGGNRSAQSPFPPVASPSISAGAQRAVKLGARYRSGDGCPAWS
jgi:hypothetical protein